MEISKQKQVRKFPRFNPPVATQWRAEKGSSTIFDKYIGFRREEIESIEIRREKYRLQKRNCSFEETSVGKVQIQQQLLKWQSIRQNAYEIRICQNVFATTVPTQYSLHDYIQDVNLNYGIETE